MRFWIDHYTLSGRINNMKILVLCLPGIGDALMATPMVKLLKHKNPDAEIDIACMFGGVEYVFKNNKNISNIYKLSLYKESSFTGFKQILSLRKNKYDLSILAFPAYRREYHLVQWLIGAKKRITHKFEKGFFSEFNFLDTDSVAVDEDLHNVENNLNLLKVLGIDWRVDLKKEDIKYDLILNQADIDFGEEYIKNLGLEKEEIVGVHPGSTLSPAALLRRWPIENYAEVAKYLIKERNKKIIIFVGPDEVDLGEKLLCLIDNSNNCHLIKNINFGKALGILKKVKLLICNDNGFGHLANGLGVKIITLWASTNDKWSLPYNKSLVTLIRPENFKSWHRYDLKRSIPEKAESGMNKIEINQIINNFS